MVKPKKHLFVATGLNWYFAYIPYQIYTLLASGNKCDVLIIVEKKNMTDKFNLAMDFIQTQFDVNIRYLHPPEVDYNKKVEHTHVLAKYIRFLLPPRLFKGYYDVYIGDADCLIYDGDIFQVHDERCKKTGLQFSNTIRGPRQPTRMGGLHYFRPTKYYFSRMKIQFNKIEKGLRYIQSEEYKKLNLGSDEHFLYYILDKDDLATLNQYGKFWIKHGFHFGGWGRKKKRYNELGGHINKFIKLRDKFFQDRKFLFVHRIMGDTKVGGLVEHIINLEQTK